MRERRYKAAGRNSLGGHSFLEKMSDKAGKRIKSIENT